MSAWLWYIHFNVQKLNWKMKYDNIVLLWKMHLFFNRFFFPYFVNVAIKIPLIVYFDNE